MTKLYNKNRNRPLFHNNKTTLWILTTNYSLYYQLDWPKTKTGSSLYLVIMHCTLRTETWTWATGFTTISYIVASNSTLERATGRFKGKITSISVHSVPLDHIGNSDNNSCQFHYTLYYMGLMIKAASLFFPLIYHIMDMRWCCSYVLRHFSFVFPIVVS